MNPEVITQTAAEPHVFLIGRPPINEFVGFVTEHAVERKEL